MNPSDGTPPSGHFRGRYAPGQPLPSPLPKPQPTPEGPRSRPSPPPPPEEPAGQVDQTTPVSSGLPLMGGSSTGGPSLRPAGVPAHGLVAAALLAGAAAVVAAVLVNRSPTVAPLAWQASCGSAPVSGSRWWPVLGPAEAVETIRSRYCGDAYVTADGASQVASFSSFEEATAFAQRLSGASGYSFRVGEAREP